MDFFWTTYWREWSFYSAWYFRFISNKRWKCYHFGSWSGFATYHRLSLQHLTLWLIKAYVTSKIIEPFAVWIKRKRTESNSFFYWYLVYKYIHLTLMLIRAQRAHNFTLYKAVLQALMKYIFILDHQKLCEMVEHSCQGTVRAWANTPNSIWGILSER